MNFDTQNDDALHFGALAMAVKHNRISLNAIVHMLMRMRSTQDHGHIHIHAFAGGDYHDYAFRQQPPSAITKSEERPLQQRILWIARELQFTARAHALIKSQRCKKTAAPLIGLEANCKHGRDAACLRALQQVQNQASADASCCIEIEQREVKSPQYAAR